MADEDLKKISKALSEQIKPLHGEIARIHSELSNLKTNYLKTSTNLSQIGRDIARIDSELENINETLNEHTDKLDGQSGALIEIESVLKGYADQYKINRDQINRIKEHLGLPTISVGINLLQGLG